MTTWEDVMDEPDPGKRREIPAPDWVFDHNATAKPDSDIEALMMAAPGDHTTEVLHDHGDTYQNLEMILGVELDLTELEQEVLDCLIVAGHSIRGTAELLGLPQTTVWRIKEGALSRIRNRLV
jgi:DNA-directed RNA polymerase specialized sigma subunit